ncbi:craniofacial development protein 2 [Elysia marginata]|uniref:Craniofacial development protein 2 n=1 Tax=Elysia marginata TaxID=1093978 RepID=A0AAV4HGL4_9GAST|nr:craniofacial development protein 2 [Elysia marginata]
MNENGELFADMCANNQMVIGGRGSLFQHRRIHQATWISPNYNLGTENQIDHMCVNHSFRSSLQDVNVFRGADVGSDHHLVVTKIKLNLGEASLLRTRDPNTMSTCCQAHRNERSMQWRYPTGCMLWRH